jgi:glycosyltransferase involved in cell wall biosynthesis
MKILLLMDPAIPVPPIYYGGIERVVYDMACEYVKMGHEVTLVAGPNSKSPGRLIIYGANANTQSIRINFKLSFKVASILFKELPKHDVIHNFGRLFWLFPVAWFKIRKVQTYMRFITPFNIKWLNMIGVRNIFYTAVSNAIVKTGISGGGNWNTVYNCAPVEEFECNLSLNEDAPLVFLGRLERCKGAHSAIKVALLTGKKLIIAGNISPLSEEKEYFENELKPYFVHPLINYIGVIDNIQKQKLLCEALAMLLPVEWFEPFPIVIPESYACGTPILAFPGGGVPEGIDHGITGFICNSVEEMASHVSKIKYLNREDCRRKALKEYSRKTIASKYLDLYNS